MSTVITPPRIHLHSPHEALHMLQRWLAAARRERGGGADWLERLAAWEERQPVHRRLGSYLLTR